MGFFTGVFQVFCLHFRGYIFWGIFFRGCFPKFCQNKEGFNKNNIKLQMDHCLRRTTTSILNNKSNLILCQLLLSTLTFGLFQVSRRNTEKLLFNMVLVFLLSTWNIAITYMTDSIVCGFILPYFKCLGLLCSVAQVGNCSFIFRDAG